MGSNPTDATMKTKYLMIAALLCLSLIGCVEPRQNRFYVGQKVKVLGQPGIVTRVDSHDGSCHVTYADNLGKIHWDMFYEFAIEEDR